MKFPYHKVPDGAIFAPHHLYVGLALVTLAVAASWDDQKDDPLLTAAAGALLIFSFTFVWPYYPWTGAVGTLVAMAAMPVAAFLERELWTKKSIALGAVGWFIALDDALEHAFGIATPLDSLFNEIIRPALPSVSNYLPI